MRHLALLLVLLLGGCMPIANLARDAIEGTDAGARLTYLTDGIGFDSGDSAALGVILIVLGDDLLLVRAPEGASCEVSVDVMDCRLGNVTGRTAVMLTASERVWASASYRRYVGGGIYQVFGR
jgi:hypothetical protein